MTLWEDSLNITKDVDTKACIIDEPPRAKLLFLFWLSTKIGLSAAEGQYLAGLVLETLHKDRCEERFSLFWDSILIKMKGLVIEEQILPRKRKQPNRFKL